LRANGLQVWFFKLNINICHSAFPYRLHLRLAAVAVEVVSPLRRTWRYMMQNQGWELGLSIQDRTSRFLSKQFFFKI